jgi:HTH-type transcriptional regulator, sugar sensing transcriptional regulator
MNLRDCLTRVGFTGQEATLYETLCREGQLTGYEAAKLSGVSRSNAYLALSGLAEKGAAWKVEGEPQVYVPVPAAEFVRNLRRAYAETIDSIARLLPEPRQSPSPFITISGRTAVLDKMRTLVEEASLRVYVSMAARDLGALMPELTAAARRIKVVVITDEPILLEGAQIHTHAKKVGQVRLIADTAHVLTGSFSEVESYCLYSKNKVLVDLIKDSLTNELELIRLSPSP